MTPEEHNLISGLFDRLGQAANSQAKDPEADQLIRSKVAEIPVAPYLLVQSTLVMQQALSNAQNRISTLEKQLSEASSGSGAQPAGGGGFLAGVANLFGGGQPHPQPPRATPPSPPPLPPQAPMQSPLQPQSQPYGYPPSAPPPVPGRGGGFLQGALSTAAGVAGGALLFQGIESLIGHNPGPFSGAMTPSGGFFGGGGSPIETTEITNNYYEGDENRGQVDQPGADQTASLDPDPDPDPDLADPDPDPVTNDDYASDNTDFGGDDSGGGDDNYV
jgi:hypothetical protein